MLLYLVALHRPGEHIGRSPEDERGPRADNEDVRHRRGVVLRHVHVLLEVPSNLILARVGARRWIAQSSSARDSSPPYGSLHTPTQLRPSSGCCSARGGGLHARHHLLPFLLVPAQRPRAGDVVLLHRRDTRLGRRPAVVRHVTQTPRRPGPRRLALVVSARRSSRDCPGRRCPQVSARRSCEGPVAERHAESLADRSAGKRSGRPPVSPTRSRGRSRCAITGYGCLHCSGSFRRSRPSASPSSCR